MRATQILVRRFPGGRRLGGILFAGSFLVYLSTLAWSPFPGVPAQVLTAYAGEGILQPALNLDWGALVRLAGRLPGVSLAAAMSLFSAVCGAFAVALAGVLTARVRYRGLPAETDPAIRDREEEACRLSGLVAGGYLAFSTPFWVASTRTLPATFHLLLLLFAGYCFSEYQRTGSLRILAGLGVLYGAGMAVFSTFLLYLPLALVLLVREWFQQRTLARWKPHLVFWSAGLLGLGMYPVQAKLLLRWTGVQGGLPVWGDAMARILREQVQEFSQVRFHAGFFVIMFFAIVPWILLFLLSRRSPWYYDLDQILVRFVFAAGLLAILFNVPFGLWQFLGTENLQLTPLVLLAASMGYMAGEFWILGGCVLPSDASWGRRMVRRVSDLLGPGLPIVLLAGGLHNLPAATAQTSRDIGIVAADVLDRLEGRDILFSHGFLDDVLLLEARHRRQPLRLVNVSGLNSPLYRKRLACLFPEPELQGMVRQGRLFQFTDELLATRERLQRVALLDMPEAFRRYAHPVPDGLLYRLDDETAPLDLAAHVALQRPFWAIMERMARCPMPNANPARRYQDMLRAMAAKAANNLGVLQAERGDMAGAVETFLTARRIDEANISVLMNLLEIQRQLEHPGPALDSSGAGVGHVRHRRRGRIPGRSLQPGNGGMEAVAGPDLSDLGNGIAGRKPVSGPADA